MLKRYARSLANKIIQSGEKYTTILIITKGGLHLGYYLADYLGIKDIQTVNISSPHSGQPDYKRERTDNNTMSQEKHYLIVDDLIDTGGTIDFLTRYMLNSNGDVAVLFVKENARLKNKLNVHYLRTIDANERVDFYYEK